MSSRRIWIPYPYSFPSRWLRRAGVGMFVPLYGGTVAPRTGTGARAKNQTYHPPRRPRAGLVGGGREENSSTQVGGVATQRSQEGRSPRGRHGRQRRGRPLPWPQGPRPTTRPGEPGRRRRRGSRASRPCHGRTCLALRPFARARVSLVAERPGSRWVQWSSFPGK